jgi:FkbM family methyltransferase
VRKARRLVTPDFQQGLVGLAGWSYGGERSAGLEFVVPLVLMSSGHRGWESQFVGVRALLVVRGLIRSFLRVHVVEGAWEYYRAILVALAQSLRERRPVHPSNLLRADVWVRYRGQEYLLSRLTTFGYYLMVFEPRTERLLSAQRGGLFLDIGANVGQYTLPLSRHFRRVIALEPNPVALAVLQRNLERNGIENVTVIPKAIGEGSGRTTIFEGEYLTTWSQNLFDGTRVDVETVGLDDLLVDAADVDLMKIDVEGAELDAIRGSKLIGRVKLISIAATSEEIPEMRAVLESAGFKVAEVPGTLRSAENLQATRLGSKWLIYQPPDTPTA